MTHPKPWPQYHDRTSNLVPSAESFNSQPYRVPRFLLPPPPPPPDMLRYRRQVVRDASAAASPDAGFSEAPFPPAEYQGHCIAAVGNSTEPLFPGFAERVDAEQLLQFSCSKNGACQTVNATAPYGRCVCLIHFSGDYCEKVNRGYFDAWTGIYLTTALCIFLLLLANVLTQLSATKRIFRHNLTQATDSSTPASTPHSHPKNNRNDNNSNNNKKQAQSTRESSSLLPHQKSSKNSNNSNNSHRAAGGTNSPPRISIWRVLVHVSTQRVIYALAVLACLIRAYDFYLVKLDLEAKLNEKLTAAREQKRSRSVTERTIVDGVSMLQSETVSDTIEALSDHSIAWVQPHFLVSFFYVLIITCISLIICYWSECFFVSSFSLCIERKRIHGVFLRKSSIAFIIFTSVLYLATFGQLIISAAAKLLKQDTQLSTTLNSIFLLSISVLMFAVHVVFLAIGVEIYCKLHGAFCYHSHVRKHSQHNNSKSHAAAAATAALLRGVDSNHSLHSGLQSPIGEAVTSPSRLSKKLKSLSMVRSRTFSDRSTTSPTKNLGPLNFRTTVIQASQSSPVKPLAKNQSPDTSSNAESQKHVKPASFNGHPSQGSLPMMASVEPTERSYSKSSDPKTTSHTRGASLCSSVVMSSVVSLGDESASRDPHRVEVRMSPAFNANNNNNRDASPQRTRPDKDGIRLETNPTETVMARLGLVSQGFLTLILSLFIASDIMRKEWKDTIDTEAISAYLVCFRIVEFGTIVWFPACMWRPTAPHLLWILNPRTLLKSYRPKSSSKKNGRSLENLESELDREHNLQMRHSLNGTSSSSINFKLSETFPRVHNCFEKLACWRHTNPTITDQAGNSPVDLEKNQFSSEESRPSTTPRRSRHSITSLTRDSSSGSFVCYICCDKESKDKIIHPCKCKEDLGSVHHECLKIWILSNINTKPDGLPSAPSVRRFTREGRSDGVGSARNPSSESERQVIAAVRDGRRARRRTPNTSGASTSNIKALRCKVCDTPYKISQTSVNFAKAFQECNFSLVIPVVFVAGIMPYFAWLLYNFMEKGGYSKLWQVIEISIVIVLEYGCFKLLGFNLVKVYIAAQQGAMKILNFED